MAALRRFNFTFGVLVTFLSMAATEKPALSGQWTSIEDHPYMVNIGNIKANESYCGGALVTPDCVLTAAMCVQNMNITELSVLAGGTTLLNATASRRVELYTTSPGTNEWARREAIAILKLDQPLRGEHIQPIPLDFTTVHDDETVSVMGWFLLQVQQRLVKELMLRSADMTVMPWIECARYYKYWGITSNTFCGIDNDGGVSRGEYGGPVVRNGEQVGVFVGGMYGEHPGIFTKFSNLAIKRFIKKAIYFYCDKD